MTAHIEAKKEDIANTVIIELAVILTILFPTRRVGIIELLLPQYFVSSSLILFSLTRRINVTSSMLVYAVSLPEKSPDSIININMLNISNK